MRSITSRVKTKRIYAARQEDDGARVLVDRVWPRGVTKDDAALDAWFKDIAPSTELRRWFAHRAERWPEFQRRYADELDRLPDALLPLMRLIETGPVTLLFAARDGSRNNAVALKAYLLEAWVTRPNLYPGFASRDRPQRRL